MSSVLFSKEKKESEKKKIREKQKFTLLPKIFNTWHYYWGILLTYVTSSKSAAEHDFWRANIQFSQIHSHQPAFDHES